MIQFNYFFQCDNNNSSVNNNGGLSALYYIMLFQNAIQTEFTSNETLKTKILEIRSCVNTSKGSNGIYLVTIKEDLLNNTDYTQKFINYLFEILKICGWDKDSPFQVTTTQVGAESKIEYYILKNDLLEINKRIIPFFIDSNKQILIHEALQNNLKELNISIKND